MRARTRRVTPAREDHQIPVTLRSGRHRRALHGPGCSAGLGLGTRPAAWRPPAAWCASCGGSCRAAGSPRCGRCCTPPSARPSWPGPSRAAGAPGRPPDPGALCLVVMMLATTVVWAGLYLTAQAALGAPQLGWVRGASWAAGTGQPPPPPADPYSRRPAAAAAPHAPAPGWPAGADRSQPALPPPAARRVAVRRASWQSARLAGVELKYALLADLSASPVWSRPTGTSAPTCWSSSPRWSSG